MRAGLHVNAEDGFAEMAKNIEAMVAEFEAELIFALGVEAAMAFVAGGKISAGGQFANVNFRMNFQSNHKNSPVRKSARYLPVFCGQIC
jgi:hypothetical protein